MNAVARVLDALALADGRARSLPPIIAIDGPAGAGKSTLAAQLSEATGAPVVGIDDFLGWSDLDPERTSWWPRLESEVIEPFLGGRALRYRRRDWHGDPEGLDTLPELVEVAPSPLLILEGVTVARRALADRLSVQVWVEAPRELCLARGLARDGEAQRAHWLRWQELEAAFFAGDRTRERADVVVATA